MRFINFEYPKNQNQDRPFQIFAALLHRTMGDFTEQLLFAASLKEMFPSARLDVYYKPDRPYKPEIVSFSPQVDSSWPTNNRFPIDLFDTAGMRPVTGPEIWHGSGCDSPNLILTPSMSTRELLGTFSRLARFRLPEREKWESALLQATNDGSYCVLHYREGGYQYSYKGDYRNIGTDQIEPIIDFVLNQKVNVVRIGHPEMTPLLPRHGFVDLSGEPFMLQACAISRARFFLELSPSGPSALANAFGIPMLRANAIILSGPATVDSIVLRRPVLDPTGKEVNGQSIAKEFPKELHVGKENGYALGFNSIEQIEACAAEMIRSTSNVIGWRELCEDTCQIGAATTIEWPMSPIARHRLAV